MIQAERLLFQDALKDPANQRFVLLSDSCIPIYNFSYIYNYLMRSPRSFVDSFLDTRDNQYNPMMAQVITKEKWRKGSQWITLIRKHAEVVVVDNVIFPVFRKFCKRRPPVDSSMERKNLIQQKQHNCIPDEHYVSTLFAMNGLEMELERRTLTYSMWNQSTSKTETETWHPFTFSFTDSSPQVINQIRDIERVDYETELRTEVCKNNATLAPCFLFARKFSRGAAIRLMSHVLL